MRYGRGKTASERKYVADVCRKSEKNPDHTALVFEKPGLGFRTITYRELAQGASFISGELKKAGVKAKDRVAVSIPPSPEAVCAVIGVLWAGAAYVPVNAKQPVERRRRIYEQADIRYCLAASDSSAFLVSECVNLDLGLFMSQKVPVEEGGKATTQDWVGLLPPHPSEEGDAAYIIFTSGSTGQPKGVEIAHGSAVNTIDDIVQRFDVGEEDRAIGISALDFDLSVFDIFGMLSAGGSLAIVPEQKRREPGYWKMLIDEQGVTLWNTVPALFEMLMTYSSRNQRLGSLRLVLLSGDWVKTKLFEELRIRSEDCRFIALGGATEASIWSNWFEVTGGDPPRDIVPYGKALTNQVFRIVKEGKDVEPGERGELWIGGKGLAKGYVSAPEQTAAAFITDAGERWYRTGDFGYFLPDGTMIFAGRQDSQVKLNGFRIELGEIDGRIKDLAEVSNSVTVLAGKEGGAYLASAVELKRPSKAVVKRETSEILGHGKRELVHFQTARDYAVAELIEKVLHGDIGVDPIAQEELTPSGEEIIILWEEVLSQSGLLQREEIRTRFESLANADDRIFRRELLCRADLFRRILTGEQSALCLLDDDLLSVEKMMTSDKLAPLQTKIVAGICDCVSRAQKEGRKARVGMLMGRGGKSLIPIMEKLDGFSEDLELLYVETSDAMLREAEHTVSDFSIPTRFLKSDFTHITEEFIGTVDAVVAINSLHRFHNIERGLDFLKLLLREQGYVLAGESTCLEAVGLVSAAVLEDAFSKYTDMRAVRRRPMLSLTTWREVLEARGLSLIAEDSKSISNFSIFTAVNESESFRDLVEKLRRHCEERLLSYMNPLKFCFSPAFPLTANGKVDRKAISAWFAGKERKGSIPLTSETEKRVAAILSQLLQLTDVFSDTDFFEVGGDSLLAVRLINAVKTTFAVDISMREVFDNRTVSKISQLIDAENFEEMDEGEL